VTANNSLALVVLRRPQVQIRTGLARSTIYELMSSGKFPLSVQLTDRSVGWLAHEVDEWIASRVSQSRQNLKSLSDGEVSS
jgi:prophage regulatory protein